MSKSRDLNFDTPVSSRVYGHMLGGKDSQAADRYFAADLLTVLPEGDSLSPAANREWLMRAVKVFVRGGIRQLLDIGCGLPWPPDVHEVAQEIAPECRVFYVDSDPLVPVHGRALMTSDPAGAISHLCADLRSPDELLREARRVLDWSQPVGLLLVGVLHHVPDEPYASVARIVDALPPGSLVAISHLGGDLSPGVAEGIREVCARYGAASFHPRPVPAIRQYFSGTTLMAPGLVPVEQWRGITALIPESESRGTEEHAPAIYGGVGRKP